MQSPTFILEQSRDWKMNSLGVLFLLFLIQSVASSKQVDDQCFTAGECLNSTHIDGAVVENQFKCLELCTTTADANSCAWFTYFPSSKYCQLLEDCETLSTDYCQDCLSGQSGCQVTEPNCYVTGECQGPILHVQESVSTRTQCLRQCKNTDGCKWFTYLPASSVCLLYEDCTVLDETCQDGCVSGESRCEDDYVGESPWHMIIGGKSADKYLSSVELYNWATGQQCALEDLPQGIGGASGAILDGSPMICGGTTATGVISDCYMYSKQNNDWQRLPNLLTGTSGGSSVFGPDQSWYIFGGNTLAYAQKLTAIGSTWERGPNLQDTSGVNLNNQCAVQISENVTAFFGGSLGQNSIMTYDWSSTTYTFHQPELIKPRLGSSCGLIKGSNGESLVAIASGVSKGLEFWDPQTDLVEQVFDALPPEEGATVGLGNAQMIPIKEGSEFMLYGGFKNSHHKGMWRFDVAQKKFTRVGSLMAARGEHVALPVTGIECPL